MPIGTSRGLSFDEVPAEDYYAYDNFRNVLSEECVLTATLDFKVWGQYNNLECFFTTADNEFIKLYVYTWGEDIGGYGPKDRSVDFSKVGIEGNQYKLFFEYGKRCGKLVLKSAQLYKLASELEMENSNFEECLKKMAADACHIKNRLRSLDYADFAKDEDLQSFVIVKILQIFEVASFLYENFPNKIWWDKDTPANSLPPLGKISFSDIREIRNLEAHGWNIEPERLYVEAVRISLLWDSIFHILSKNLAYEETVKTVTVSSDIPSEDQSKTGCPDITWISNSEFSGNESIELDVMDEIPTETIEEIPAEVRDEIAWSINNKGKRKNK